MIEAACLSTRKDSKKKLAIVTTGMLLLVGCVLYNFVAIIRMQRQSTTVVEETKAQTESNGKTIQENTRLVKEAKRRAVLKNELAVWREELQRLNPQLNVPPVKSSDEP